MDEGNSKPKERFKELIRPRLRLRLDTNSQRIEKMLQGTAVVQFIFYIRIKEEDIEVRWWQTGEGSQGRGV